MENIKMIKPESVFHYFAEISKIPHGSENMTAITKYCLDFAEKHSLKAMGDEAGNVIIWKVGTKGYEHAKPVILQGHLDMVCQKTEDSTIDFQKDGLELYVDGDFLKAKGTTLGADNGIAVSMILSILASDDIPHPPIEAVFTTDEEIGMIGAGKLSVETLSGKRMINLDAEEADTLTVSCAGGSDFRISIPISRKKMSGTKVTVALKGLKGGHSGVEIHAGRVNANILAGRVLNTLKSTVDFQLLSINGGDKGNAITPLCEIEVLTEDANGFYQAAENILSAIKKEMSEREPDFEPQVTVEEEGSFDVCTSTSRDEVIYMLLSMPNGVVDMSAEIEGLVETSLNLGILQTVDGYIRAHFTLRSNKKSALRYLEEKLRAVTEYNRWQVETFGHYPPWEFNENSALQELYIETYKEKIGEEPKVVAIHAGLECGLFSSKIEGLDCIAIGPFMMDVHTVNERLSISSTQEIYEVLLKLLEKCK